MLRWAVVATGAVKFTIAVLVCGAIGCGVYTVSDGGPFESSSGPSHHTSSTASNVVVPTANSTQSDSTDGPRCDLVAPACGGDVAGSWTVRDCPLELTGPVDVSDLGFGCSTGRTISSSLRVSGKWTADSAGKIVDTTTTRGVHEFTLPQACLDVLVGNCESLAVPLENGLGYETVECVDNVERGGCLCAGTFNQEGGMAEISTIPFWMGTYTTQGNVLTTSDRGLLRSYDYCVYDDALVLTLPAPGKLGQVMGSIALSRE